jgi:hypothetical protein
MRLIRRKFEAWLKAKPAEEIVGHNCNCHACPLALYYAEASGGSEVVISSHRNGFGYVVDRGDGHRRMPAWADAFAFLVDSEARGAQITAGKALEILGEVS